MKRNLFCLILLCLYFIPVNAQWQKQLSSGQIYEELEKFNFLGSVLYIAAHPDDENTRLISYLSNGLHARTAYLSLTRGDGGQNLIGTEIRELLGVLRSQELQMARATDGGQQFFTRANDFGYSKHPDETLEIWNKEQVFDDIIRVIRTFRPDVIINRFDHRTPGRTHGHHTSSAMLSVEAFDKSNDRNIYPYQLSNLEPWQVKRQFFNTSWWFYGSREKFAEADKSRLVSVEVGGYYPTLGISNNEISGLARSKHRSQGFGSSGSRSSMQEYLELVNGDMPRDRENIFDGINTRWTRVKNGEFIDEKMKIIFDKFDFRDPSLVVPDLLAIYPLIENLEDKHWKKIKKDHLDKIVQACMGLFIEVSTIEQQSTRADSVEIEIEVTSRSHENIILESFEFNDSIYEIDKSIEAFVENTWYEPLYISESKDFTNPYWLNEEGTLGTYKVDDPNMRNLPESPAAYTISFNFSVNDQELNFTRDVIYLKVDPSVGEVRQPFVVLPPATMTFNKDLYLFSELNTQEIEVKVKATKDDLSGTLKLEVPSSWSVHPEKIELNIPNKGMEKSFSFVLHAPEVTSEGQINASFTINGQTYDRSLTNIVYDHIPLQSILKPAASKIVKVPLKKGGTRIAYIMGAVDKMIDCLEAVVYNISLIEP
ncbi:MAG: PIG-L family deacetylase, partial [Bacteroidia bacterium]|nr:PIG-L family deacetylase [Bacteroidia bacterium]